MIKKLTNFLTSFSFFKPKMSGGMEKESKSLLPDKILGTERIVRFIYSPFHLNKKKKKLVSGAYRTPPNMDEVSVNRFDYTDANTCKGMALKGQDIPDKTFFGFGMLNASQIKEADAKIVYSPVDKKDNKNPFHADIKIGYTPVRGVQIPAEFQEKMKKLANSSRLYIDEDPQSQTWDNDDDLL